MTCNCSHRYFFFFAIYTFALFLLLFTVNNLYISGSGSAEGYHRRLDEVMPKKALPVDKMVDFLAGEDEYWARVVNDPRQWEAKKVKHRSDQLQNQMRRTITTYIASSKNPLHSAALGPTSPDTQLDTTSTHTSYFDSLDSDVVGLVDSDIAEFDFTYSASPSSRGLAPEGSPFSPPNPSPKDTSSGYKRGTDPSKLCANCKQRKANGACSQRSCKICCVASVAHCSLTDHMRGKKGARQADSTAFSSVPTTTTAALDQQATAEFERKIREVIATKKHIFISYKGDNLCRHIEPHAVEEGKEGLLVRAMDHTRNGERSFYIAKISRMEDSSWQTTTQGNLISFFFK
jgi:hypothetical protein